jgi:allophanate hydrolase subunit 2
MFNGPDFVSHQVQAPFSHIRIFTLRAILTDISRLAQAKPGDTATFRRIGEDEALKARHDSEQGIRRLASLCRID